MDNPKAIYAPLTFSKLWDMNKKIQDDRQRERHVALNETTGEQKLEKERDKQYEI